MAGHKYISQAALELRLTPRTLAAIFDDTGDGVVNTAAVDAVMPSLAAVPGATIVEVDALDARGLTNDTVAVPVRFQWSAGLDAGRHTQALFDDRRRAPQLGGPPGSDGGREALERAYMWAILFDRPDKQALARRLEPSANDVLCAAGPDADGTQVPRRSDARRAEHRRGQGHE